MDGGCYAAGTGDESRGGGSWVLTAKLDNNDGTEEGDTATLIHPSRLAGGVFFSSFIFTFTVPPAHRGKGQFCISCVFPPHAIPRGLM